MAQESAKPHREALGELLPELFAAAPAPAAILRPQLQAAARSWLADIARSSTLLIGVDDFVDAQNVAPGQQVLLDASVRIELTSLTREDSENLLKSLFNDAPDIGTVAHRLYELACSNPRDLLQLAQHLVAQGSARYEGGCWTLGLGAHDAGLPSSMEQAVRDRVAAISGKVLELASALALCPDLSFSLEECASLCQQGSDALITELSELDDVARPFGGLGAGVRHRRHQRVRARCWSTRKPAAWSIVATRTPRCCSSASTRCGSCTSSRASWRERRHHFLGEQPQ